MESLKQGDIIYVLTEDENGYKKRHPVVIMTPVPDRDDAPFVVLAISGEYKNPRIPKEIPLPADPDGKLGTNAKKDCAIICNWPNIIRKTDIIAESGKMVRGRISPEQLRIAAHFFRSLKLSYGPHDPSGYPRS